MRTDGIPVRQRILGMALGGAVGDALGAPFEFGPPGQFSNRFSTARFGTSSEMIGGGPFGWAEGEFTDDTQMALTLADSLRRCGQLDRWDVWQNWVKWAESAPDVGVTTARGLTGVTPGEAAARAFSAGMRSGGNGALMRTYPVALFGYGQNLSLLAVMKLASRQALLTHGDTSACWVPGFFAGVLWCLLNDVDVSDAMNQTFDLVPDDAKGPLATAIDSSYEPGSLTLSNGSAWGCLADACWAVRTTDSFTDALVSAIDVGGDTDTVACVTGALAGTTYGVQAIPARWTNTVNGWAVIGAPGNNAVNRLGRADIIELACELAGIEGKRSSVHESAAGPTEVAPGLYAASLPGARAADERFAVVSLCATGDTFSNFARHREFFLIDDVGDVNPHLEFVVHEAVATIDAFRSEGFDVLVHCHGGRSRTGLVLAAWQRARTGADTDAACAWVEEVWPRVSWWNNDFVRWLRG